jgi:hypothetical protein
MTIEVGSFGRNGLGHPVLEVKGDVHHRHRYKFGIFVSSTMTKSGVTWKTPSSAALTVLVPSRLS